MRLIIHRGANEIGGSCVELESRSGSRLLLDLGMPLTRPDGSDWPRGTALRPRSELRAEGLLPSIAGVYSGDTPTIDGLVLSHAHIDHYGLAHHVDQTVPVFGSPGTLAVLRASKVFVPDAALPNCLQALPTGAEERIGAFLVRAIPVDHSAPAACALLIEADGQRILYSGDFRAHGPHPELFASLAESCQSPDVLILEGTTVGQEAGSHGCPSEADVQERLAELLAEHRGAVVVAASGQNVDRLVSAYRACRETGRELVVDPYQAYVLHVLSPFVSELPQFSSPGVRVKFVSGQVARLKEAGLFGLACAMSRASKLTKDEYVEYPDHFLLMARSNGATVALLTRLAEPGRVAVVWSMWKGYWNKGNSLRTFCEAREVEPMFIHSGGHASTEDLTRLVEALHPRVVVPVHTQSAETFSELFPGVVCVNDGCSIELADLVAVVDDGVGMDG